MGKRTPTYTGRNRYKKKKLWQLISFVLQQRQTNRKTYLDRLIAGFSFNLTLKKEEKDKAFHVFPAAAETRTNSVARSSTHVSHSCLSSSKSSYFTFFLSFLLSCSTRARARRPPLGFPFTDASCRGFPALGRGLPVWDMPFTSPRSRGTRALVAYILSAHARKCESDSHQDHGCADDSRFR